jgi:WD40 repeat protein
MDTVTSLAISKNHLISGSKDKNLRLWALDHSIYNLKSTVHASNDYINTVESKKILN